MLEAMRHALTNRLPVLGIDQLSDAAICNNLDLVVGDVDVHQHAAIVFGIPDAILGEQFPGASSRGKAFKNFLHIKRMFDDEAYFPTMACLSLRDGGFYRLQGVCREHAA